MTTMKKIFSVATDAEGNIKVAKRMYQSGCREVGMGIESGSDKILGIINKGETTETMKRGIDILKRAGTRVKGFLIVGLPSESMETIEETQKFLKSSGLDDVDFSLFTPYKKTMIYDNKEKFDIQWDSLDLNHLWYKGTPGEYESQVRTSSLSRQDLVAARDMLESEFVSIGRQGGREMSQRLIYQKQFATGRVVNIGCVPLAMPSDGDVLRELWRGLEVRLHRDEVESYYHNLISPQPLAFVIMRDGNADHRVPAIVTLCFDEASAYLEADDQVEPVAMPPELVQWVEHFVVEHYVPERRTRRERKAWNEKSA